MILIITSVCQLSSSAALLCEVQAITAFAEITQRSQRGNGGDRAASAKAAFDVALDVSARQRFQLRGISHLCLTQLFDLTYSL